MVSINDSLMMLLDQEVFVVASDETLHKPNLEREFHIFDSEEDLREGLTNIDIAVADQIRIFHGILTMAECLPPSTEDRTAYVIVAPLGVDNGMVVEAGDTLDHIEDTVMDIINNGLAEEINLDIDDLFILYGYEISPVLACNEEELDEEALEGCRKIASRADDVYNRNKHTRSR